MNKKIIGFLAILLVVCLFSGCASKQAEPEARELEGTVKTVVLEHKGTALGVNLLPVWVETYITEGVTGLEKLADYEDQYCFVAEETASNLNAGQAWVNGFDIPQDIARNVASRVDAMFTGSASGSPEGDYGTYFENIVKAASNTEYTGARKVSDWWVLVRRYDNDIRRKYTDEYRIYVLYTIEKDILDRQVLNVIEQVEKETESTAEQSVAINNVKDILKAEGLK